MKDEVDQADILSERRHGYSFVHGNNGWTELKVLADPSDASRDLLDGGRRFEQGRDERFTLRKLTPRQAAHLVIRSAPESRATVRVLVGGVELGRVPLEATEGVGRARRRGAASDKIRADGTPIDVTLANDGPGDFIDYHVWVTQ